MLTPTCEEEIILQKLGVDTAYTFKGLYKTADWLEFTQKWLLLIPIVLSVAVFIFQPFTSGLIINILVFVGLVITIYVILTQRDYDKKKAIRELANEFKTLYDKLFADYCGNEKPDLKELAKEANQLRLRTAELPVSWIGYLLCRIYINREMDLAWTERKIEA